MNKQIKFNYKENDYTLEYTRASVSEMERRGFSIKEVDDKHVTGITTLFSGAFISKHKFAKPELINEIYEQFAEKEKLIKTLVEMYVETITTLMDEPEEGKIDWVAI